MRSSISNIGPLASDICERGLRRGGIPEKSLAADVDRYWHCIAAQIEAGLIDDTNEPVRHGLEKGLAAYRDWRARHPDHDIPPMHQPPGTASS
jgi:hypothetical protein